MRHRKSWSSSSAEGALKEKTWQPAGLSPDMTCSIVLSLPAPSMAWNTTSSAHSFWANNFSCSSCIRSLAFSSLFSPWGLSSLPV